jgi:curved DNA-binding protein
LCCAPGCPGEGLFAPWVRYNSIVAKRDYYEVLGVGRDSDDKQIRAAYRKLARKFHPDVNKSPDASDKFKEATEAYEVLSDPEKRRVYDQFGHAGPPEAETYRWTGTAGPGGIDFGDIFGRSGSGFVGMGLEDILAALRGGRGARRARGSAKRRGSDINYDIALDFMQAVGGTTATLRLHRPGSGGKEETIQVRIPPGVREGSKVRVRGKGAGGPGGSGDLYIVVHVNRHPYFRRAGDDVYIDLPISIVEAALGAKVDVPTVDGMTTVTIPPGTGGGRKLRLRGKGVGRSGAVRGDHYVVIKIFPPREVSQRGEKLLREFDDVEKDDVRSGVPWK